MIEHGTAALCPTMAEIPCHFLSLPRHLRFPSRLELECILEYLSRSESTIEIIEQMSLHLYDSTYSELNDLSHKETPTIQS